MLRALFGAFVIAGLVTLPFYVASRSMEDNPKRKKEALEKAIERNHVVEATLVKSWYANVNDEDYHKKEFLMYDTGIYEFEWQGKKYRRKVYSFDHPYNLTMYFVKDPSKAAIASEIVLEKPPVNWKPIAIITFILAFWFLK